VTRGGGAWNQEEQPNSGEVNAAMAWKGGGMDHWNSCVVVGVRNHPKSLTTAAAQQWLKDGRRKGNGGRRMDVCAGGGGVIQFLAAFGVSKSCLLALPWLQGSPARGTLEFCCAIIGGEAVAMSSVRVYLFCQALPSFSLNPSFDPYFSQNFTCKN
jgi:hypothetical protein